MIVLHRNLFVALLVISLSRIACAASFQDSCTALASNLQLPNVKVQFTQYLTTGTNLSIPDLPEACTTTEGSSPWQFIPVDLCRAALLIETSTQSNMTLEVWLPVNWTGRFLNGGDGGYTGCIQYVDIAYGASLGFATVSGNNGHNGTTAAVFWQHPEVLEDYVYRAIYTGAIVGKQVTTRFYGKPPMKSYFMGCSGGGRQGFKFAQDYPDIFDGIIAAAPAINFVNLINWGGWLSTIAGFNIRSPEFISLSLWNVIHKEILRQCDGLDGSVDGLIEDPDLCDPIFETIICKDNQANSSTCLNPNQAARVRQIFQPLYGIDGTLLYPRQQPGNEVNMYATYVNGTPSFLASDWYRYIVYDPSFNVEALQRRDFMYANAQNPYGVSTWKADLSAFKNRGGKILTLHGMQDTTISAENSKLYYHRVAETLGQAVSDLDEWYRYFRVSGMAHCAMGDGAWNVGMYSVGPTTPTDPDHNVLARIVAWVEQGQAPETIGGIKYINSNPTLGVEYKRKHCKYPARNKYVGPGNYTDSNAWNCTI